MDAVLLARWQFALTIGFHYLFPPLTIGMAWLLFGMYSMYLVRRDVLYLQMTRFWLKLFAVSFAIGVATGITMEFQFGMNWAAYSRFVGDIFGAPLAAEGVFAFFLESSFLGVLLFGEKRVSERFYWFSTLMVAVGSTLSAFWIIVANSWQQTPAGYAMANGRAELTDFFAAVFNPSTLPRYIHTINSALLIGGMFVMGLSAFFLLRERHRAFAERSLRMALIVACCAAWGALLFGHWHAVVVGQKQPIKLAAYEGHWQTGANAPLLLFGLPNAEAERTDFAVAVPGMLSLLLGGSTDTVVKGLAEVPADLRPPLIPTFLSFHTMFLLGTYFIGLTSLGVILLWRRRLFQARWYLRLALWSLPLPFVASEVGWIAAEMGRQPWIVTGMLLTKDAVSATVPPAQVLTSIIIFGAVYSLLFYLWLFLLRKKLAAGPAEVVVGANQRTAAPAATGEAAC